VIVSWYVYLAHFVAGAFLANAVPHFVNGISGRPFPTPFASPPGQGESSSTTNVWWALVNLAVSYVLLYRVGTFALTRLDEVLTVAVGVAFAALGLARGFGRIYGGASPTARR
jgi:hypothetical protein